MEDGKHILLFDGVCNLCNASRSEEHTSELQSRGQLVCRLLLEKKKESVRRKNSGDQRMEAQGNRHDPDGQEPTKSAQCETRSTNHKRTRSRRGEQPHAGTVETY